MKQVYTRTDFEITIKKEEVFHIMDCYEDSPVYDIVEEEYEEWEPEFARFVSPVASIVWDTCDRTYGREDLAGSEEVFFVLQSVGNRFSEESTKLFAEGNTLGAMMLDAMADAALNELNRLVSAWLREICGERHIGILRRLEPTMQIPIEAQEWILHKTEAQERFGIGVTSGYMFDPVKTIGYVLLSTGDTEVFKDTHNCRLCDRKDCKMRNIQPVTIKVCGDKPQVVTLNTEQTIMDALKMDGRAYTFPCGGRGTCGKCRIRLVEGELPVTKEDERFFNREELDRGYRLACQAYPVDDVTIEYLGEKDDSFEVLTQTAQAKKNRRILNHPYMIAIDIGTTTLAVSLIESASGQSAQVYTAMNRQRSFGADVIARIKASCDGKGGELQKLIREDLLTGIREVISREHIQEEQVGEIAIAGNTTMGHLLMGLSCETLGVAPFTPVDISMRRLSFEEVFGTDDYQIPVLLLPGISTYVGADITAGMLSLDFAQRDDIAVLIDLGTNGEMAVGNRQKILVTSTAAGPAFEGGNISCGVGSVAGAISDVIIDGTNVRYKTIGGQPPVGICGTGAVAVTAELLRNEWIDETGLLDEDYFDDGFLLAQDAQGEPIVFTQKDVREMQLANAAVRAGLETLLVRYGIAYDEIDKVYLAGGFGYKMNLEKAVSIGLIPRELSDKVEAVGNSSLTGACDALLAEGAIEQLEKLCQISEEVNLSTDKKFNEFYMEYMMFEVE